MMDELVSGRDELGVLLLGHKKNAYWYGSNLTIEEARRVVPNNNATSLQVCTSVLSGTIWTLENPNKGITQMNTLVDSIRELIPQDTPSHLHVEYHRHVFEIVNEWHLAGILHFGRPDDPNSGHPWITLTEFGKECIQTGNFLPYDPE